MPEQPYKRPPITEAVIELRHANPADANVLRNAAGSLKSAYPVHTPLVNYELAVNLPAGTGGNPVTRHASVNGHRLSSNDQAEVIILWPLSFVFSQLAPYPGWSAYFDRFARDWATWKRVAGYHKINRIGLRYINRIDIPRQGNVIEETDYLKIYAKMPVEFGVMMAYGVQAQFPPDEGGMRLTINSGSVLSPLLGHSAILLDLDVSMEVSPPQRDDDIFNTLNEMRNRKNTIFEACLTDHARELFQK